MKLNKFAYLYSKSLGNHDFKNNAKIPGNLLKKTWKNHGNIIEFFQSKKVGNPVPYPPPPREQNDWHMPLKNIAFP